MTFALAALLLLSRPYPQDPPTIAALIQQLDASAPEEREAAFETLVKMGSPALPALREAMETSTGEELKIQARRAITAIEDRAAMERACPPCPTITLDLEGTLRELAEAVALPGKFRIETNDAVLSVKSALHLKETSLFEALDRLCAGRDDCTWEMPEAGLIRFLRDRHPACPAVYSGAFRIRLAALVSEHETDFKKAVQHVSFLLMPDLDRSLQPITKWTLDVTEVTDGTDRKWTIGPERHVPGAGAAPVQMRMAINMMQQQAASGSWYHADDIDSTVKTIKSLKGVAVWKFPFNAQVVGVTDFGPAGAKNLGGIEATLREQQRNCWLLTFSKKESTTENLPADVQDRLDMGSIMLTDAEGKEVRPDSVYAQNAPVRFVAAGGKGARPVPAPETTYRIIFTPAEGRKLTGLRFRFVDRTFEKRVPFEFKDLPLP